MCFLTLPSGSSPCGSEIGRGRIGHGGPSTESSLGSESWDGVRVEVATGSLHSRSFFKSPYHSEIPTVVVQVEYDVWNVLQNNSRGDGK